MITSLMHIGFFTDRMEEMLDFYTDKLGGKLHVLVRYKEYLNRPDRPAMYEIALKDPERIYYGYIEIAPGQFIELFPKQEGQIERTAPWNSELGYTHFGLLCDDIYATRAELEKKGVAIEGEISKGPSETYQMWCHDPDGNKFEVMQFTDKSYQVIGHIE